MPDRDPTKTIAFCWDLLSHIVCFGTSTLDYFCNSFLMWFWLFHLEVLEVLGFDLAVTSWISIVWQPHLELLQLLYRY